MIPLELRNVRALHCSKAFSQADKKCNVTAPDTPKSKAPSQTIASNPEGEEEEEMENMFVEGPGPRKEIEWG